MYQKLSFKNIVLSLFGIAFAFLFPHLGIIPIIFGYSIPVLVILWLLLKTTRENWASLGFSFKDFELKAVWIGAIAAVLLFAFLNYFFFPLLSKLFTLPKANLDDFAFIRHHLINFIFILSMSFLIGGWYEELVFHGFIFTRFEKMIPKKYSVLAPFLITNIIFSLYHWQLGIYGIINAFLAGCAYQGMMLKFKRNMWYAIFFHGFFDVIAFTYIFLGYW